MRLLVTAAALAATVIFAAGAGTAAASTHSCGTAVINDWYVDGSIDGQYPSQCYRAALGRVTDQMKIYSDLPDQLIRGLRAALVRERAHGSLGTRHTITQPTPTRTPQSRREVSGPIQRVLGELGPARADSIPVPLLVLAGVALLLIAAGAVSAVHRRLAGRRSSSS